MEWLAAAEDVSEQEEGEMEVFARLPLLIIIDTQNICSTITAAARYYSASRDSIDIDRQCMFVALPLE